MSLKDLTRPDVDAAIAEFDWMGRDAVLREHGFGRSRGYFLVQDGREYDSNAIAEAAHGHLGPEWQRREGNEGLLSKHAIVCIVPSPVIR